MRAWFPPMWAVVGFSGRRLWVPLLLLWLILLPIVLLLAALLLLTGIVWWVVDARDGRRVLGIVPAIYGVICALKGTDVEVEHGRSQVIVRVL